MVANKEIKIKDNFHINYPLMGKVIGKSDFPANVYDLLCFRSGLSAILSVGLSIIACKAKLEAYGVVGGLKSGGWSKNLLRESIS